MIDDDVIEGVILEEEVEFSLSELSQACAVQAEWLVTLVEEGILEPSGAGATEWRFSGVCLKRAHSVQRLQRDLDLNLPGVALVLDLMEELEALRIRVAALDQARR
jgi:chaperone modulatory protein CbpM